MRFLASAIAVLALFDSVVFASSHAGDSVLKKRHLGKSPSIPPLQADHNTSSSLEKRADNVRFSFFDPGLGACGGHNTNRDFIVALNTPQWDGGSHCGKTITIRYNGKSTQATIVDRCVECPYGGLDFSRGLFDFFASQDDGYLWGGSWDFGNGAPPPKPKPETTSHKPRPTPTPTPTPKPELTTTKEAPTTTSTNKTKTNSKHTNTISSTLTTDGTTATPTETAAAPPPDSFLNQLNMVLMGLAGVAAAAAQE